MTLTENPAPRKSGKKKRHPVAAFFHRIYRLLYSKVLGVVVILAMAVAALIGTMVRQMPAGLDDAARERWIEQARPSYGGWTEIFDALGFFNLWSSPIFLFLTAWLTASIIACTTHRLPTLTQQTLHPRVDVSPRFFGRTQYRAEVPVPVSAEVGLETARRELKRRGYRVVEGKDGASIYSDKFRWGPWGTVLAHASFVIIIVALLISAVFSLDDQLEIAIGDRVPLGHGTDIEIEALNFVDTYDEQGRPIDYVGHLVAYQGGVKVAEEEVRVNTPMMVDGIRFHQASFGIAANMLITDADGTVFHGAVPLKYQDEESRFAIGKLTMADEDLELIVVTPASGRVDPAIPAGTAVFELYELSTDVQLAVVQVDQGEAIEVAGRTFTFERERPYTGVLVRQDPGTIWMWIGSTLLIVGMMMTFGLRPRRIWARADTTPQGTLVRLAAVEKPDTPFEAQFRDMAERIEAESLVRKESQDV